MRRAILQITNGLIAEILKGCQDQGRRYTVIKNALPKDAEVIDMRILDVNNYSGRDSHIIEIVLQSESFEDIPVGKILPTLPAPIMATQRDL